MRRLKFTLFALMLLTQPLAAQCIGENLIAALPAAEQDALRAAAESVPHANGNYWRATRGDEVIHLIGTYHFDDPRHDATLATLQPVLKAAKSLLVEAGPEEEAAIKSRLAAEPDLMINTTGPTLPEMLSPQDWALLSAALRARGIPPFMAAKFRPWYISVLLAVPPCDMARAENTKGLDKLLIEDATYDGLPVHALEPYDTVFQIFDQMSPEDQMAMVTSALATESRSADFAITLADSYFAEEGRLIWEFMRYETLKLPGYTVERTDAELATMEQAMMTSRNRKWIPVIEEAATHGPVLVAFGALHLSGDAGVLSLLEREGFTVERLALQ
ncbi:MAG: TraB/GumN family protein [Cypionkella sp.]|nr:TraB/GumN family protein [Cypionkella sp.]